MKSPKTGLRGARLLAIVLSVGPFVGVDTALRADEPEIANIHEELPSSQHPHTSRLNLISQPILVGTEDVKYVSLPKRYYVTELVVRAEAEGHSDAAADIFINGRSEGSVFGSGNERDPIFNFAIDKELRQLRIQGKRIPGHAGILKITSIVVELGESDFESNKDNGEPNDWSRHPECLGCDRLGFPTNRFSNPVAAIANRVHVLVDRLDERDVNHWDFGEYLVPIKLMAADLEVVAEAPGPLGPMSDRVKAKVAELVCVVDQSKDFLLRLTTLNAEASEYAREILKLSEWLDINLKR